jgi:hypothetical protein
VLHEALAEGRRANGEDVAKGLGGGKDERGIRVREEMLDVVVKAEEVVRRVDGDFARVVNEVVCASEYTE